ncbi:MAG: glycosyltransferase [Nitrospinota bacterium]|nr:glycosyltransferase [Nitrospinota bacterium]
MDYADRQHSKQHGRNYRLVFVDDGGTDKTAEVIREISNTFPVEMLKNNPQLGRSFAFDKGFRFFLANATPEDILVTMEGDDTSDLTTLPRLLEIIRSGKDFALA